MKYILPIPKVGIEMIRGGHIFAQVFHHIPNLKVVAVANRPIEENEISAPLNSGDDVLCVVLTEGQICKLETNKQGICDTFEDGSEVLLLTEEMHEEIKKEA